MLGVLLAAAASALSPRVAYGGDIDCALNDPAPLCAQPGHPVVRHALGGPTLELTVGGAFIDPRGRTMKGSFYMDKDPRYDYPGNLVHHDLSFANIAARLTFPTSMVGYFGFEFGLGPGSNSMLVLDRVKGQLVPTDGPTGFMGYEGGVITGIRVPLGYVSLRFETLFGGQGLAANETARAAKSAIGSQSIALAAWKVEPRGFIDIWVSPTVTMSAFVGVNALHPGDHVGGLSIGAHGSRFDGAFSWF